ncbi:MAG: NADP-dependent phosphogluconate dehydrogenase, partial [Actinobacteria bacterium]|nr:NADP-dependent phosphogluconate dehydrogenase [Actinomycetota bacterium]
MKIGMVGLGRMGGNMVERLRRGGHEAVGFDADPKVSEVASLEELISALDQPRTVWLMVPAGKITQSSIDTLSALLAPGDVVVDGGNSNYRDSMRRSTSLSEHGIGFIDAGVSGGVWGLQEGYSLMVGGDAEHVERLRPIFETLAPPGGFAHVGIAGAGHFTKMVHNGIEYGLMQAYAEGFELLSAAAPELSID